MQTNLLKADFDATQHPRSSSGSVRKTSTTWLRRGPLLRNIHWSRTNKHILQHAGTLAKQSQLHLDRATNPLYVYRRGILVADRTPVWGRSGSCSRYRLRLSFRGHGNCVLTTGIRGRKRRSCSGRRPLERWWRRSITSKRTLKSKSIYLPRTF